MNVLYIAVPIALFISLMAVWAFVYQVRSGQFDDLETPPLRILFDDIEGQSDTASDSKSVEKLITDQEPNK